MARKPANQARPANAERGEITLTLDGGEFVLRPSHEAIEAFESAIGKGLIVLAREAVESGLRLGEVAQIVTECVRAWGRATGDRAVQGSNAGRIAELIMESDGGLLQVSRTVATMLALASTGGYTAQGEAKAGTLTTTKEAVPAS